LHMGFVRRSGRAWAERIDRVRLAVCAAALLLAFWLLPGARRGLQER
jgi:hypothetical protein